MAKRKKKEKREPIGRNGLSADDQKRLASLVERIENLQTEARAIATDIKDVKAEGRKYGFDMKTINEALRERALTPEQRQRRDDYRDTYFHALGCLADTPLGAAAVKAAGA